MGNGRYSFKETQTPRLSLMRRLGHSTLLLAFLWLAGFLGFVAAIPSRVGDSTTRTDAIIVLTGGSERLAEGFRLLGTGISPRLLITGVADGVKLSDLVAGLNADSGADFAGLPSQAMLDCCVTLEHQADDTIGNARESAAWIRRHKISSVRLITANYHMNRSLLEFRYAVPEVTLLPNPVFPGDVRDEYWFIRPRMLMLVGMEYHKYVGAWLRDVLRHGLAWVENLRLSYG